MRPVNPTNEHKNLKKCPLGTKNSNISKNK